MSENLDRVFKTTPGRPWQTIDSETIIIDPVAQFSHELDHTGSFIWNRLDGSHSLLQIVDALCAEFSIARELATEDVVEFVETLESKGLVICQ